MLCENAYYVGDKETKGRRGMTDEKLKPCPFCGKKARLQRIGELYYVACDGSYCRIKPITWAYSVKEKAIEEWNRRANNDND